MNHDYFYFLILDIFIIFSNSNAEKIFVYEYVRNYQNIKAKSRRQSN